MIFFQGKGDSAGGSGGPTNGDHRDPRNRKGGDSSGSNGGSGGSGSNGERNGAPRLPQKEKDYFVPQNWAKVITEQYNVYKFETSFYLLCLVEHGLFHIV